MTSSAAPSITDLVADLHAYLGRLADHDYDQFSCRDLAVLLTSLSRAESRIAALRLRVLASADRASAASADGLASTGQWAAKAVNLDPVVAERQVRLSQQLEHRSLTQRALAAGELSPDHAAVIVQADEQLPVEVGPVHREVIETALVEQARTMPPALLRRAARRALAAVEADSTAVDAHEDALVRNEEAAARSKIRLTLHDNSDGTVTGHFTVPTLHGHLLQKIIQTITAPRRGRLGASTAQAGTKSGLRTDWDQARGSAFCELIEHLPTDHLHPRTAATVVVTISDEVLRGALAVAHLDTGAEISAGEARRLACGAGLLPVVLDRSSVPLDLGRSARLFSEAQRTALGLQHRACAADGCERPFAWCELHHEIAWSRGGATDLARAIPLCHFHHRRVHDRDYSHAVNPGGISFHRRT